MQAEFSLVSFPIPCALLDYFIIYLALNQHDCGSSISSPFCKVIMPNQALIQLCSGLPLNPLPVKRLKREENVPHAPILTPKLTQDEFKVSNRLTSKWWRVPSTTLTHLVTVMRKLTDSVSFTTLQHVCKMMQ